ncbi:MAG: hypothetical protein AAGJ35_02455, partial [Myxococcota bacterium]
VQGPRGNDCDTSEARMLCLPISERRSICHENCTQNNTCQDPAEQCIATHTKGQKACYKMAQKGETCGAEQRIRCPQDLVSPPVYCVRGTCTERPAAGWDVDQTCTPPNGNAQSDCKTGLECIQLSAGQYRCAQSCSTQQDCKAQGEACWDAGFGKRYCLLEAKENQPCDRAQRRLCRSDDPKNYPLTCKNGKCVSTVSYTQIGEICRTDLDATKHRGDCAPGLLCLAVSQFEARCHHACGPNDTCPDTEVCLQHPNPGRERTRACAIPVQVGDSCAPAKRKLCASQTNDNVVCIRKDEHDLQGQCTLVTPGDRCRTAADCGRLQCTLIGEKDTYCLSPCRPGVIDCPNQQLCLQFRDGAPFACLPDGPNALDTPCKVLQPGPDKLETRQLCKAPLYCQPFHEKKPEGLCVPFVNGCKNNPCTQTSRRICVSVVENQRGFCARDCSTLACPQNTACRERGANKICSPK